MAQEKILIPAFDPLKYKIINRNHESYNGWDTAATIEILLPETGQTIWSNCDNESATIFYTEDVVRGPDIVDYDEVYCVVFDEFKKQLPDSAEAKQWLPIIKETLAYFIKEEIARGCTFSLPVVWLPDAIREKADEEFLDSMYKQGKNVCIVKNGISVTDEDFDDM